MQANRGFLLDTHIFIWWMGDDKRLSQKTATLLRDPHNQIFLSTGSIWEMIIKKGKGKLNIPIALDLESGIRTSGFNLLSIEILHVLELEKLPQHHKDPFDRILIAQAKIERLILITDDVKIAKYEVDIFS